MCLRQTAQLVSLNRTWERESMGGGVAYGDEWHRPLRWRDQRLEMREVATSAIS
jgi:hypothetical protein